MEGVAIVRFAVINIVDGTIRQINEVFGSAESLEQINARLAEGQMAVECVVGVSLEHTWNAETEGFDPPAEEEFSLVKENLLNPA